MWQASAKSPAPSSSIEAPPSTDVLALQQHLRKPETALAVQLRTGKMASGPSCTRHACPEFLHHSAAVGGVTKQPNTSSSTAVAFRQPGTLSETIKGTYQTTNSLSRLLQASECHQMGDGKRDSWPVPEGQGLPLPSRAFFPSQQLSWDTIWVQQNTATFVDNRWTSRRRKVFIPRRVFLSYMLLNMRSAWATPASE
jgi:hypothetical protein